MIAVLTFLRYSLIIFTFLYGVVHVSASQKGVNEQEFTILDFEDDILHDRAWLESQPEGTIEVYVHQYGSGNRDELSLAVGEGRGGGNALRVEAPAGNEFLQGFYLMKHRSSGGKIANIYDEKGYLLPRGMMANRLEFWIRFEAGFREKFAATSAVSHNVHIGTYNFDPALIGKGYRVDESHNWHFYHMLWFQHDQAGSDWMHVVVNATPQHRRGSSVPPIDPTQPQGNYFELMTRFYVDLLSSFEVGRPAKMWVDDIKLSYVSEPDDIELQIENYLNGQTVVTPKGRNTDFTTTITNMSQKTITGSLIPRSPYQMVQEFIDPDTGEKLESRLTLAAGETREFTTRITPNSKLQNGRNWVVGVGFVPDDQLTQKNRSHANPNVLLRRNSEQGPPDAHIYGTYFYATIGQRTGNNRPRILGGLTFYTSIGTPVTGTLTAADPENDALIYSIVTPPKCGKLILDATNGEFKFTPNPGFKGVCRFHYKVNDGTSDSTEAASWLSIDGNIGKQHSFHQRKKSHSNDSLLIWPTTTFLVSIVLVAIIVFFIFKKQGNMNGVR